MTRQTSEEPNDLLKINFYSFNPIMWILFS